MAVVCFGVKFVMAPVIGIVTSIVWDVWVTLTVNISDL